MTFPVAAIVTALDVIAKYIAVRNMGLGQSIPVLPGIFHFTLIFNKGAAFGLFRDQRIIFIPLSLLVITAIIMYQIRKARSDRYTSFALGLILGGAVGNLIDRVRLGYVVDFIDLRVWPVFNIADSCVTIGAILLLYCLMTNSHAFDPLQDRRH